jgi:hypothetical protein
MKKIKEKIKLLGKEIDKICMRLNFLWVLAAAGLFLLGSASVGHIIQCALNAASKG